MTNQPPKSRRGCFFYGCITCVVLLLLLVGALLAGVHYVKKMVNRYTDTQPMELPTVQMPQGEVDRLKQRFEAFRAAVREQRPTPPLTLGSDDINALIAGGTAPQALKGKLYVSLDGDQLKGQVSAPLEQVGLSMFKGRYLNGSATFNLAFRNGALFVTAQTITVKGKPLPERFMQRVRNENLAAELTRQPETAALLQGLEDIRVSEGKLVIVPKEQK
jgi:hypothetical protein